MGQPHLIGAMTEASSKQRIGALDGLRGLALVAVMLFHADPNYLPGGFVGPDLFFALSGYLIARLSADYLRSHGSFRIPSFWSRRFSRLLPAACVVVAVSAWVVPHYASLAQLISWKSDVLASLTGWMNWKQVAGGSDYFAATSVPSPLLHFWTYAIEFQFYLLWPVLFWALTRSVNADRGKRSIERHLKRVRVWCVALAAVSFTAQIILGHISSIGRAYYGTDTRIGALLLGAALGLLPLSDVNSIPARARLIRRGYTGLAAMIWAAIMIWVHHDSMVMVSGAMVVETMIAVLFVRTAVTDSWFSAPMRFPPLRWLGKVSYSVYLWHFPIWFVFITPKRTGLSEWPLFGVRFAVAFAIGAISYELVERNAWRVVLWRWTSLAGVGAASSIAALTFGFLPAPDRGLQSLNKAVGAHAIEATGDATEADKRAAENIKAASEKSGKEHIPARIFLMGDSQVAVFGSAALYAIQILGDSVGGEPLFGCGLWTGYDWFRRGDRILKGPVEACTNYPQRWKQLLDEGSFNVALFWPSVWDMFDKQIDGTWYRFGTPEWDALWQAQMRAALANVQRPGIHIVLLTEPYIQSDWMNLCPSCDFTENDPKNIDHLNEQVRILAAAVGGKVLDLNAELAPNGVIVDSYQGVSPIFSDGTHISTAAAQELLPWLSEELQAILRTPVPDYAALQTSSSIPSS